MSAPQFSPVWPGPALLVPITLDALLVGTGNQVAAALWAQTGVSYGNLSQLAAGVTPFQQKNPPRVGAHLLWTLPYSIRSGKQAKDGSVNFPMTPNRWAVLRSFVPPSTQNPSQPSATVPVLSAGILRSDSLHSLGSNDSPYPGDGVINGIGDYVPLEMWDGSTTGPAFLQVPGPGDVSWSAAYDNIRNVFAFHDDLTGRVPGFYSYQVIGWYADPASDPLSKWSTQSDWLTLMGKLGWGVGQDQENALPAGLITAAQASWQAWQAAHGLVGGIFNASGITVPGQLAALMTKWGAYYTANGSGSVPAAQLSLPAQTLCHGALLGVQWKGANWGYPSGAPPQGSATVAVGNTPAEAVAAWMANWIEQQTGQQDVAEIETALEAFQKGLIFDLAKQPVETAASLHAARFAGNDGGTHWVVVRPEQAANEANATGSGNATIPLTQPQIAALRALNDAQSAADAANREIQAIQWELWALYYKLWYNEITFSDYQQQVTDAITALIGAAAVNNQGPIAGLLGQAQKAAANGTAAATAAKTNLEQLLAAEDTTKDFVVKQINNVSFTRPVDPVVLVAGAKADTKHAPPGAYGTDGFTFTRFTGQTLMALTISQSTGPANAVRLDVADLQSALIFPGAGASPSSLGIPKELADLWLEALLADGSCSAWLASVFAAKYQAAYHAAPPISQSAVAQLIVAQQTALWNDAATLGVPISAIAAAAQFAGTPPNPVAFEDGSTQPWSPLFIDWEIEWHPSPLGAGGLASDWQLSGLDYQWTGTDIPQKPAVIYQGRTSVDPLASQNIAQQLENFVSSDPDFDLLPTSIRQDLNQIKTYIQNFDFITQSFGGITEQWLTHLNAASMPVPSNLFGSGINPSIPQIVQNAQGIQPVVQTPAGGPPPYFPIRAGHFRITNLWVVDAYGQVLSPKHTGDTCVHFSANSSLQTPKFADYVQVPPRFNQSTRLNFTMIDANDDSLTSNSADATSPICGWVMSNHLDDSLMVFDGAGNNLGSVIVIDRDEGQTGLRWDAAPGSSQPLGAAPDIENTHLAGFINALLLAGANGSDAMRELLDVLDAASWKPQTLGQAPSAQGNLAVLAGRPYAVVRSRLDMELFGDPLLAVNQDISLTGSSYPPAAPPAFTTTAFSMQVGDEDFATNSAVGYFIGDDYGTFHSVTANPSSTSTLRRQLAAGESASRALAQLGSPAAAPAAAGTYVVPGQPLSLAPNQKSGETLAPSEIYLTILVDPAGRIPVVSGGFPVLFGDLPPGPVATALDQMNISFRVGPLLLEPTQIRMPLPSEMHGDWAWMERQSVTLWAPPAEPAQSSPIPSMGNVPLRLREGWLVLSKSQEPS
jgi:hypothetical protein